MPAEPTVFDKTYASYLKQIQGIDLISVGQRLGGRIQANGIVIPLFGEPYTISPLSMDDPTGNRPPFDDCVILSKYLLLCPEHPPTQEGWVSYREVKDSGPLGTYFAHDVEGAVSRAFSGRLHALKRSCRDLGGYPPPEINAAYDLAAQFDALPRIPVILLFNDRDEEFPARCHILFRKQADRYLDAESLAVLGRGLFTRLHAHAGGRT